MLVMVKKKIVIISGIIVLLLIVVAVLVLHPQFTFQSKEHITEKGTPTPTPKEELIIWDDPAGFTFQYPKGLQLNKHDEDKENYAHVELTNPDHKGSVIVWEKDTTATTIAQWLKNEKSLASAVSVDTTLGGNEAKKVMVKEPNVKQITATLDEDVVVMVEANLEDQKYWQRVNDTIIGSLSFSTSQKTNTAGGDSSAQGEPVVAADETENIE